MTNIQNEKEKKLIYFDELPQKARAAYVWGTLLQGEKYLDDLKKRGYVVKFRRG
jgi:hypothetical protein